MTFTDEDFRQHRAHLRGVAYRMLGSLSDADDAVQEAWLHLTRAGGDDVQNLRAWLTTATARVCLDMLRARARRREDPLDPHVPDPVVQPDGDSSGDDPEQQALLADSVGLALLVVLDTLTPAERLAFVLHDVFAVPFGQVADALDRTPDAAKQLASRARRRLQGAPLDAPANAARQREVADAFLAASRHGDFEGLLTVLDPDVVLRADTGDGPFGPPQVVRGALNVTAQARRYAGMARHARPVRVNGGPGFVIAPAGRPLAVIALAVTGSRIDEIDILADPERLARLDLGGLAGGAVPE
jgi:RNA polymerase sigma-70 factor (ECF subfamily)